ncbi:putative integral membrane protein [Theileria parva strain Muguga]|uniref:putative integral membrane protein n=1 Tax=Theileria parva strain Muguga TaxID=333668 RepID=UPI001C6221CD|nr:putative integral membrane protein [Theileria parva strain Muguga]EAN31985.2 putative integral membrane protein [Theileria parva strain Muguga]
MRFKNLLYCFRGLRFKSNLTESSNDLKPSPFIKKLRRRFIHDFYFDIEDDYKRLSRSSKISYYALGFFLLIPSGLSLFSPSSPAYVNLLSHQFKLSSMTLSWISSSYLAFSISKFGNTSLLANSRGFVGLLFAVVGVTGALIIGDYSMISGLYTLMSCYILLGLYNYILTINKLLPRCIFLPSSSLILLNLLTSICSLIKSYSVKSDLTTSNEEIILRFESSPRFKKSSNSPESGEKLQNTVNKSE